VPYQPDIHIDQFLTTLSLAQSNQMYSGDTIFPSVNVDKPSDLYPIYGTEALKLYDDVRRPGANALEVMQTLTKGSYFAEGHALKTKVPYEQKRDADNPLNPEIDATVFVTEAQRNQREFAQMAVAGDTTQIPNNLALSGTTLWSDYTYSVPLVNIRTGRTSVRQAIHREPTDICVAYDAGLVLADHPSLKDLMKYTDPNMIGQAQMPMLLRGLQVSVSGADKDTSAYGAPTPAYAPVFSKGALIHYRNPNVGLRMITFGVTLQVPDPATGGRGQQIRKWEDEAALVTWIQSQDNYTVKILSPTGAYLFLPCIA
jgi:hypothetical protein